MDPYNPALSHFDYNWLTPSRVQLKFGIKGTKDDEYTDYYQSHIIFTTNYSPSRRGRIRFQVNAKFVNAYLLVAGTYDWFSSNDYGWAGAYYKITVDHSVPSGGREMLFNTWNGNSSSTYFHTMYENLVEAEADSESNLYGVNVRTPFWPNVIPNLSRNINSNNNGGPIVMNVGDTIQISTEFLFDAQAYGDESAEGFVNIKDWLGEQGYLEMEPLVVLLEECAD